MRLKHMLAVSILAVLLLGSSAFAKPSRSLDIYFIDVEGGQATLIVTPQGQSLLIDTGWPGFDGRDADRIVAAVKDAGLKQIDFVLITHYHRDHVGGAPQLAQRIKVGTWVDHGPNLEETNEVQANYAAYQQLLPKSKHIVLKPGDSLPLKGVRLEALTGAGEHIGSSLPGAGQQNGLCAGEATPPGDPSENARSLGTVLTYGKFRFLDLGDLTKQKELELVCPVNRVGAVDVYLVDHHGFDVSNPRALVEAVHPKVAIMNNGAHKGDKPAAWQIVHDSPGLQDLWQLHTALDAGAKNVDDRMIANPQEKCEGKYLKISAQSDGTFTVTNQRNGYTKHYD